MLESEQGLLVVPWKGKLAFSVHVVPSEGDTVEAVAILLRDGVLSSKVVHKMFERQLIGEFHAKVINNKGELNGVAAVSEEAWSVFSGEVATEGQVGNEIVMCNAARLW